MKIAVYTIAKNEEQFVKRWADSCADADYRLILDTGSTDHTLNEARTAGVAWSQKFFNPWRFDHARNHSLSLIPDDIDLCIALDMDEVLQPNWRAELEKFMADNPTVTRPRYKYVWSWNPDGSEGLVYGGDKIHARHGYVWKHPVHEVITPTITETQGWVTHLEIHHHPDSTKSRGQYFPLLKLAIEEDPNDDRNQFYLAREYFYTGDHYNATVHFERHMELSQWGVERAANRRMMAKMHPALAEKYLYQALSEAPDRRESWVDLAMLYHNRKDWEACRSACLMALRIKEKPLDYLCEAEAWGALPHDLLALSSYFLGDSQMAIAHGTKACELNPIDERLKNNLIWYAGTGQPDIG